MTWGEHNSLVRWKQAAELEPIATHQSFTQHGLNHVLVAWAPRSPNISMNCRNEIALAQLSLSAWFLEKNWQGTRLQYVRGGAKAKMHEILLVTSDTIGRINFEIFLETRETNEVCRWHPTRKTWYPCRPDSGEPHDDVFFVPLYVSVLSLAFSMDSRHTDDEGPYLNKQTDTGSPIALPGMVGPHDRTISTFPTNPRILSENSGPQPVHYTNTCNCIHFGNTLPWNDSISCRHVPNVPKPASTWGIPIFLLDRRARNQESCIKILWNLQEVCAQRTWRYALIIIIIIIIIPCRWQARHGNRGVFVALSSSQPR